MNTKFILEEIQRQTIYLPNGKAGFLYNYEFIPEKLSLHNISDYYLEFPEGLSFTFDKELSLITGAPEAANEYELKLFFKLKDQEPSDIFHEKIIKLIINPDPKSLWKNIKSDLEDPYWKPDNHSEYHNTPSFNIIAASKRGRSHAHEGKFRDDDLIVCPVAETGWMLLAVADGAGSAKLSRRGSEVACKALQYYFNENHKKVTELEEQILLLENEKTEDQQKKVSKQTLELIGAAAFKAYSTIQDEALRKEHPVKDYATTLLFLIIKKFPFGTVTASFWIGDGGMGIYNQENEEIVVLGTPDSGEFAGQTRFLTMPDTFQNGNHYSRIKLRITKSFTAIALMTDGITDPKFSTDSNFSKFEVWKKFWQDLNGNNDEGISLTLDESPEISAKKLFEWMDFWESGNHDDRTMIILY